MNALEAAYAAAEEHVFATTSTCVCGFQPEDAAAWDRHRLAAGLAGAARWIRGLASPTLRGDPFILASTWAAQLVDPPPHLSSSVDLDPDSLPSVHGKIPQV